MHITPFSGTAILLYTNTTVSDNKHQQNLFFILFYTNFNHTGIYSLHANATRVYNSPVNSQASLDIKKKLITRLWSAIIAVMTPLHPISNMADCICFCWACMYGSCSWIESWYYYNVHICFAWLFIYFVFRFNIFIRVAYKDALRVRDVIVQRAICFMLYLLFMFNACVLIWVNDRSG